jgi:dUTP pyrophosphatase
MKIKMIKFDNFKAPKRAHYNDSGADCFAAETVTIPAGKVVAVGTGVGFEIPDGVDIVVHCKSGLSSKGIWASNSPIDAGYKGETHAILFNTTDEDFVIHEGDKIGQFVVRPVIYADFVESFEEEERGDHAFGSTGR